VLVKDSPGFVVNRVLMPYLGKPFCLPRRKMPVEQIDRAMRRFGMPMGPLELLDQIGLDVAAHVGRSMQVLSEGRFAPLSFNAAQVFERMVQNGWLGQKKRQGVLPLLRQKAESPWRCAEPSAGRRGQRSGGSC